MSNADNLSIDNTQLILHRGANEQFELDVNPLKPLLQAIENSPELQPFVNKVGSQKIADVVLSLIPFAPHDSDDVSYLHGDIAQKTGLILDDGAPVSASFDFGAFNFVCIDTLSEELSPSESRGLFESLKNTNLLQRVYQGSHAKRFLPSESISSAGASEAFPDTGRAVIPINVHKVLTEYMKYLIHHENMAKYEDYILIYKKALQRMPEALTVTTLDEKERGVYVFLRDKSTQLIHFFQITLSNLRSAEPFTEIVCLHGLTTAGGQYRDTYDSLGAVIQEGFSSQKSVSRREGPNAYIETDYNENKFLEKSEKTGDRYTIVIHAAQIAQTGESMLKGLNAPLVPDPIIKRPKLNLIFIDKAPTDQLSVIIHTSDQTQKSNEALYRELFARVAPEMEFSFR